MGASTRKIDYKTAMRAMVDTRSQAGAKGVKSPGAAGSVEHRKGAGIANEQNRIAPSEAGTGSRSGAKGGPSEHPQNRLATTAGTGGGNGGPAPSAQGPAAPAGGVGSSNGSGGAEHGAIDNTVAGPRAVGKPGERIPYGGTGAQGGGGQGGGEHGGQPQNNVATSSAGEGGDGKGGAGGGGRGREGHPQNKVLPVVKGKRASGGATSKKTSSSPALGRYLAGK